MSIKHSQGTIKKILNQKSGRSSGGIAFEKSRQVSSCQINLTLHMTGQAGSNF